MVVDDEGLKNDPDLIVCTQQDNTSIIGVLLDISLSMYGTDSTLLLVIRH